MASPARNARGCRLALDKGEERPIYETDEGFAHTGMCAADLGGGYFEDGTACADRAQPDRARGDGQPGGAASRERRSAGGHDGAVAASVGVSAGHRMPA